MEVFKETKIYETIEREERFNDEDYDVILPQAVLAEIMVLAKCRKWGSAKLKALKKLLEEFIYVIPDQSVVDSYVMIDVYSSNKLEGNKLGKSETMGKNDLWIVATASATKSTLITMDRDFEHLIDKKIEGVYLDIKDYTYLQREKNAKK